jgi:L,D-transpeptidase catalytic domain
MRASTLASILAGAALLTGGPASAGSAAPARTVRLSDEARLSRYAYPQNRAGVHSDASSRSRRVSRLHYLTEDGLPENYLLLEQTTDAAGRVWVEVRLPERPNGKTGWVRRSDLGQFHAVTTLLVADRRRLTITLYRNGERIFRAPLGVGKASTPTPGGRYWIREHFHVSGTPAYGPRAIGTSAHAPTLTDWPHGGVVGIHGTDEPGLVPGRPSHGCMRMHNRDVLRLYRLLPIGTPLHIV